VGRYPGRIEAESMTLTGYAVKMETPFEIASAGKAVECAAANCTASFRYDGEAGWRDLAVQYFDVNNGAARFQVFVGNQLVAEWSADDRVPSAKIDGGSSARHLIRGLALRPGDEIRIEGKPDARETAALDYIEIQPAGN
jgi:alpha-glucuronidase